MSLAQQFTHSQAVGTAQSAACASLNQRPDSLSEYAAPARSRCPIRLPGAPHLKSISHRVGLRVVSAQAPPKRGSSSAETALSDTILGSASRVQGTCQGIRSDPGCKLAKSVAASVAFRHPLSTALSPPLSERCPADCLVSESPSSKGSPPRIGPGISRP